MEWYGWVLIAVGVIVIGYLKLKVWGKIMASQKAKRQAEADAEDE
jgi:hypothetical protein